MYATPWVTQQCDITDSFLWRTSASVDGKVPTKDKVGTLVTKHGDVRQVWEDTPYETFERLRQAIGVETFRTLFKERLDHPSDKTYGNISDETCAWIRDLRGDGESLTVIYNHTGYPVDMLIEHATGHCRCAIPTEPQERGNKPWKEEFIVRRAREGHGLLKAELAALFNCSPSQIEKTTKNH